LPVICEMVKGSRTRLQGPLCILPHISDKRYYAPGVCTSLSTRFTKPPRKPAFRERRTPTTTAKSVSSAPGHTRDRHRHRQGDRDRRESACVCSRLPPPPLPLSPPPQVSCLPSLTLSDGDSLPRPAPCLMAGGSTKLFTATAASTAAVSEAHPPCPFLDCR